MLLFLPPEVERNLDRWHQIETHQGTMNLHWQPGILIWKDADGRRWTAETAAALGWKYIGLGKQPPPPPPRRNGGRKKSWA